MEPLLLSTDIGSDIDDALALLVLLNHPETQLKGVYTVNGNVGVRSFIAKHLIDLKGADVPVGCGIAAPLGAAVAPYTFFEEYLVDDKYLDEEEMEFDRKNLHFRDPDTFGIHPNGLNHLAERLHQQPCAVLSIGPLTNVAHLLATDPVVAQNITHLWVMGFRLDRALEHNVRFDTTAADQVLKAGIPLTVIPADLCNRLKLEFSPTFQLKSAAGQYVTSMLRAFAGAKIVDQCRWTQLLTLLQNSEMLNGAASRIGADTYEKLWSFKHALLVNLDEATAYLERDVFLEKLERLATQLDDHAFLYHQGSFLARQLRALLVQKISVADVYAPYCFLNQDRLKIETRQLSCTFEGHTVAIEGNQHRVVADLDFDHFQHFLKQYLY